MELIFTEIWPKVLVVANADFTRRNILWKHVRKRLGSEKGEKRKVNEKKESELYEENDKEEEQV